MKEETDYASMSREELERAALECVPAENYFDLADNLHQIATNELVQIIESWGA